MYFISKVFWFVLQPGNLLFFALLAGTLISWTRPASGGRIWLTTISALLALVMILPVENWIAQPLEERFKPQLDLPEKIDGIIVLGGIAQARIADETGLLEVNDSAERLMVAAALALEHRGARLLITGRGEDHQTIVDWLRVIGLSPDRVAFETESRNTIENALLSYQKLRPKPEQTWLLVTSAMHMPRAVGVFRKIGWNVIPVPVDHRTHMTGFLETWPDLAGKLVGIGAALKEWVGLCAYYAVGRSDELFPAPQ